MIIDVHGHFTRAPQALYQWRAFQLVTLGAPRKTKLTVSDDEMETILQQWNLKKMDATGIDKLLFSPHASHMGHHVGNPLVSRYWTETTNDVIAQAVRLHPDRFIGVAQLPQHADADMKASAAELERMVKEHGFVGCNLNPDVTGGAQFMPSMGDEFWFPLYEKMVELDVPAMIHVSASCNPNFHGTGAHYINGDTSVFMQCIQAPQLFKDFPTLKFIIPHGGGAIPYHWGRYRGIALDLGRGELDDFLMNNIYFDTCVYHQPGIETLFKSVPTKNILFASEMIGAVRSIDPKNGRYFDDTKQYLDALNLSAADQKLVFEDNAKAVYPRLKKALG